MYTASEQGCNSLQIRSGTFIITVIDYNMKASLQCTLIQKPPLQNNPTWFLFLSYCIQITHTYSLSILKVMMVGSSMQDRVEAERERGGVHGGRKVVAIHPLPTHPFYFSVTILIKHPQSQQRWEMCLWVSSEYIHLGQHTTIPHPLQP